MGTSVRADSNRTARTARTGVTAPTSGARSGARSVGRGRPDRPTELLGPNLRGTDNDGGCGPAVTQATIERRALVPLLPPSTCTALARHDRRHSDSPQCGRGAPPRSISERPALPLPLFSWRSRAAHAIRISSCSAQNGMIARADSRSVIHVSQIGRIFFRSISVTSCTWSTSSREPALCIDVAH